MLRPLLLVLALLLGGGAYAQGVPAASGVAVYRYAEPGQPTKDIQVWGAVRSPGVYQVERDADLLTVLTLAGGPIAGVETNREERTVYVQIARGKAGSRELVFEESLDRLLAHNVSYPEPQDGDIVSLRVEARQRFQLRDAAVLVSSLGTLALVILRLVE